MGLDGKIPLLALLLEIRLMEPSGSGVTELPSGKLESVSRSRLRGLVFP